MRKSLIFVFAFMSTIAILTGCGQDLVNEIAGISDDDTAAIGRENEFYVEAGDFDVYFSLREPFSETYMLFGGDRVTHEAAFNDFWLAAISMEDARPIYEEHPDFYRCASPGAARAKKAVQTMNIVTADSDVLDGLNAAVSEFNDRIGQGGDRVAVRLEGVQLEMTAAIVRGAGQDMVDRLPQEVRRNYFLIESVEIVAAQAALEGS